jgi:hypothetical protein
LKAKRGARPNQRVQPTPLAASEIVRILEAGFVSCLVSIYEATRLTRKPLGRSYLIPISHLDMRQVSTVYSAWWDSSISRSHTTNIYEIQQHLQYILTTE